jgi:hypothetical protein
MVAAALFGAYGAVNAESLYVESGGETFDAAHLGLSRGGSRAGSLPGIGSVMNSHKLTSILTDLTINSLII